MFDNTISKIEIFVKKMTPDGIPKYFPLLCNVYITTNSHYTIKICRSVKIDY